VLLRCQADIVDPGNSRVAWCRKQGLSEASFYWWRRALARREGSGDRLHSTESSVRQRVMDAETSCPSLVFVHIAADDVADDRGLIEIVIDLWTTCSNHRHSGIARR